MPFVLKRECHILPVAPHRDDRVVVLCVSEAGQFVEAEDFQFRLPSPQLPGAHELELNLVQVERMQDGPIIQSFCRPPCHQCRTVAVAGEICRPRIGDGVYPGAALKRRSLSSRPNHGASTARLAN